MIAQEKAGVKWKWKSKSSVHRRTCETNERSAKTRKRVGAMFFRFEITEVHPARRPFVALVGWLREGNIKLFDHIVVSYTDGTTVTRYVGDIEARQAKAEYVDADGLNEQIGICISDVEADKIEVGSVATGIYRWPVKEKS